MTTEVIQHSKMIDFHGAKITTFESAGEKWIVMRHVVDGMGVSWSGQQAKLRADGYNWSVKMFLTVGADGKQREMLCMPLRHYPFWLATMNPLKVPAGQVRERVILFKEMSIEALYQFWSTGQATMESVAEAVQEQAPSVDLTPVLQTIKDEQTHTRNAFWCSFNKTVTPRFGKVETMVVTLTRWLAGRLKTLWEGIDEIQLQNTELRAELIEIQQEVQTMRKGVEMMAHQMAETNRTNTRLAETILRMTVESGRDN